MTPQEAKKKAIEACGGVARVAEALKISHPAIYQWKVVPAEHVNLMVHMSGNVVTPEQLRPDIFYDASEPAA